MGSIELAQAYESARSAQAWVMLTDLLRSQGRDHLTVDGMRAFHAETPPGITGRTVTYAEGSGRALTGTLYSPPDAAGPSPAVVFVHGGGWMVGHSVMHGRHAAHLAADGFVTFTINYRLAQEAAWPGCLDDAKAAVRYLRANAAELGIDPTRIAISGGSAGGHLSALVAAHSTPGADDEVAAAVLWYPVTDLELATVAEPMRGYLLAAVDMMLAGGSRAEASPINQVAAGHPPVLTLVGTDDTLTPASECRALHERYAAEDVDHELVEVPGYGHGFELDWEQWGWSYDRMREFFRRTLA